MAGSANTDAANRDAAMRRVAIVLSSLPASVAAKLLGSVDQASKQTIRQTMATLADVDPLERHRALQAFKVSVQSQPSSGNSIDTFTGSSKSSFSPSVVKNVQREAAPDLSSPLAFLSDVDDDQLLELLSSEHAQAVAMVLASIAPAQAARILPKLGPSLRSAALSRLGRLGDIPETAAVEVAQHFRARLSDTKSASSVRATGQRALNAILAAMPTQESSTISSSGISSSGISSSGISSSGISSSGISSSGISGSAISNSIGSDRSNSTSSSLDLNVSQMHSAIDAAHRLRVAQHTLPESDSKVRQANTEMPGRSENKAAATRGAPLTERSHSFQSTDSIHSHLIGLSAKALCAALGRVDTRDAMLTLCGLPNSKAEAVLAILPREQAKMVRGQMISLNSLNLRDIDDAKERVATASLSENAAGSRTVSAMRHASAA